MENEEKKIEQFVILAKKGDQDAFMELYKLHYREMYAYCYYMLNHQQDAEDMVSEVVLSAYENIGKLRDAGKFRQWIFKILSNQCKRKRKEYITRNKNINLSQDEFSEGSNMVQHENLIVLAEDVAQHQWVEQGFSVLSDEEKYIVTSFVYGGYKGEEIAQHLNILASTVRSKYHRALKKMEKFME